MFLDNVNTFLDDPINTTKTLCSNVITGFFSMVSSKISSVFSYASSLVSGVTSTISSITSTVKSGFTSGVNAALGIEAHATGGILTTPHLGLVAEDGPEAIIPLGSKRRSRGIALWEEAGALLGVQPYAEGGIVGGLFGEDVSTSPQPLVPFSSVPEKSSGGAVISVPVTVNGVTFHLHVDGSGDASDIIATVKEHLGELTDEIAGHIAKSLTQVFSNMPLAVEV